MSVGSAGPARLFVGGPIRTVEQDGVVEAALVVGDRIVATGTRSDCEAVSTGNPEVVDLDGATMLPGFVDAHTHPLMLGQCANAGVPVVLSSDVPVSMPDVFLAMWAAISRKTSSGSTIGFDCAIDRETALRGYTIEGAWAMHRSDVVGSIAPGKFADFAVVTGDPITCDLDALPDIRVLQTWRGGELIER